MLFHLLPTISAKRPNPGVFTALALYVPISIWAYIEASHDGHLNFATVLVSAVLGAALMALAIAMLVLGKRFGYQDR